MNEEWRNELITKGAAFDALGEEPEVWTGRDEYAQGLNNQWHYDVNALKAIPSAQPQLDTCPIYGGMCGYPSNLCYECPRHEGAKERPQWWTEGLQPFAQSQRMKGKWIDKSGGIEGAWNYCSVCGEQAIDLYDFCPNCGADMRGEEDG